MTAGLEPRTEVASRPRARTRKAMQLRRRVLLKMIESRHMPIGKELEANLGDAVGLYDYWIVLKLSGNERSGNETNMAEKIVLEYAHFPHTLPQAVVLLQPERGVPPRPFIDSHLPSCLLYTSPSPRD